MNINGFEINPQSGNAGNNEISIGIISINEGIDKSVNIKGVCGDKSAPLHLIHEGLRQPFGLNGGGVFRIKNGGRYGVLKVGEPIVPPTPPTPLETYTRLTYIECNGQQYIDLGYVVKEDDVIEADFILTKIANADTFLFGTADANAGLWFEFYSRTAYVRFGSSESKSISSSAGKYAVKLQKGKVTIGTTETTLEYEQLPNNTINLFAGKGSSSAAYSRGHYRCTKFRISDSNGLVMDLVPVKRNSDGMVGMLDIVSGTFYVSAEEPFLNGGEVRITDDYEILNHIAFNADKSFDAGIIESTYTIESLWARDSTSSSQYMYGFVTSPHTASVTAYLSGTWRWGNQGSSMTFNDKNQHYTRQYNANIYYDGTTRAYSKSPAFTTANTLVVGGRRGSDGIPLATFTGKIYYYRIYDSSSVKLEWQPCKRLSDGVEGFWDCVSQTFIEPMS